MEIHDAKYALTADDTTESSRLAQLLIAEAGKDTLRPFINAVAHPSKTTVSLSMRIHTAE